MYVQFFVAPISLPLGVLACVFQLPFTASCQSCQRRQSQVRLSKGALSGVIISPSLCRPHSPSLSNSLLLCMRVCFVCLCACVCGWVAVCVYSTGILSMLRFAFFFLKIKFNLPGVKAERGNINTLFTFRSSFASSSCTFSFLFHYAHSRGVGGAVATELEHLCDLFAQLVVASTITDKRIKSLLALIVVFTTLC